MAKARRRSSGNSKRRHPGLRASSPRKGAKNKYYLGGQMF